MDKLISTLGTTYRDKQDGQFALVIGLQPWNDLLSLWLPGRRVTRINRDVSRTSFFWKWAPRLLFTRNSEVFVWGFKHPSYVECFCRRFNIPIVRMEDGFIRSVGLGGEGVPPLSICIDKCGIYYDPTHPSDLEQLLQNYDFTSDRALMARARRGIEQLIGSGISKYNQSDRAKAAQIYGPKTTKRVLVLGQVEGDMSITKGVDRALDNNDVVRLAVKENPGAQVIYKPHPAVLSPFPTGWPQSDPKDVQDIALVLNLDIALSDTLETVDHVYTMTSLSGFEALLRGIDVTCLGMPFYAGWGATDDRQTCPRRTKVRTPEEIFAAAYLLYPRYFDPIERRSITFEESLHLLAR